MTTNITFTSNIKFIDSPRFLKQYKHGTRIGFHHNEPNILKSPEFYSCDIRTCTGGGLITPGKEAEGFHFWDDKPNMKNFRDNLISLFRFVKNPERGLLVGSKNLPDNPFSIPQFQNFKKAFQERVENITLFEQHSHELAETHYHYSLNTDTWTLSSKYWEPNELIVKPHAVKTLNDLLSAFKTIRIAKGDRLFINSREITPKDCPEIFL